MKYSKALFIAILTLAIYEKSSNAKCLNFNNDSETLVTIYLTTEEPFFNEPTTTQNSYNQKSTNPSRTTRKIVITHYFHPW